MHLGDLGEGRGAAGADRPDRLVGDDEAARPSRRRGSSPRAARRRARGSARRRARPRSRRRRRWRGGRRARRRRPCAATSASVSPWSARRSEWPTITATAPASASISAEMSPVWAPEGSRWQSWPPIGEAAAGEAGDERRGRADQHVAAAGRAARGERVEHRGRGGEAVHLPVSGDELAARPSRSAFRLVARLPASASRQGARTQAKSGVSSARRARAAPSRRRPRGRRGRRPAGTSSPCGR